MPSRISGGSGPPRRSSSALVSGSPGRWAPVLAIFTVRTVFSLLVVGSEQQGDVGAAERRAVDQRGLELAVPEREQRERGVERAAGADRLAEQPLRRLDARRAVEQAGDRGGLGAVGDL